MSVVLNSCGVIPRLSHCLFLSLLLLNLVSACQWSHSSLPFFCHCAVDPTLQTPHLQSVSNPTCSTGAAVKVCLFKNNLYISLCPYFSSTPTLCSFDHQTRTKLLKRHIEFTHEMKQITTLLVNKGSNVPNEYLGNE